MNDPLQNGDVIEGKSEWVVQIYDSRMVIPPPSVNAVELFSGPNLDIMLKEIEAAALNFTPDLTTVTGRKAVASQAYKVAQAKSVIDEAGKELVADWKRKAKEIDIARARARDFLDDLKARVRKPLTDWEEWEKIDTAHAEALELHERWLIEQQLASQRAELEKLRRQQLETERREREAQERAERERKLREEADERQEREMRAAIERERQAKEDAERRAQEAVERARLEERQKAEAEEARRQKAAEDERQRIEAEALRLKLEKEKQQQNEQHRATCHQEALDSMLACGFTRENAVEFLRAVVSKKISHVTFNY